MDPVLHRLIATFQCDAAVWVPHTLKRTHPLQDFLNRTNDLPIPKIPIVKIIVKNIVPQKTLSELERRLENAELTNHVTETINNLEKYKCVIIIDDAIGSGATIETIGVKMRRINSNLNLIAVAALGSYKGFCMS